MVYDMKCYNNSRISFIIGLLGYLPKGSWKAFAHKGLGRLLAPFFLCVGLSVSGLSGVCEASGIEINLDAIRFIESSGRADAVGPSGERGLYQVSDVLRREFNQFKNKSVTPDELFLPEINEQIADWYFHERIPALLRHFKKPVTLENVITAYNSGIATVVRSKPLPPITKAYLRKYKSFQSRGNHAQKTSIGD